jgi:hypothetical protein
MRSNRTLHVALCNPRGIVEENVFVAIQEITARWFTFLDESRRYFVPRLTHAGVLLTMAVDDLEKTRFFTSAELQGQWVYPSCDD